MEGKNWGWFSGGMCIIQHLGPFSLPSQMTLWHRRPAVWSLCLPFTSKSPLSCHHNQQHLLHLNHSNKSLHCSNSPFPQSSEDKTDVPDLEYKQKTSGLDLPRHQNIWSRDLWPMELSADLHAKLWHWLVEAIHDLLWSCNPWSHDPWNLLTKLWSLISVNVTIYEAEIVDIVEAYEAVDAQDLNCLHLRSHWSRTYLTLLRSLKLLVPKIWHCLHLRSCWSLTYLTLLRSVKLLVPKIWHCHHLQSCWSLTYPTLLRSIKLLIPDAWHSCRLRNVDPWDLCQSPDLRSRWSNTKQFFVGRMFFQLKELLRWLGLTVFEMIVALLSFLIFTVLVMLRSEGVFDADSSWSSWWLIFSPLFISDALNAYFCIIVLIRMYIEVRFYK